MFENTSDKNYLQYSQLANVQYNFLTQQNQSSGYHIVNWRINFGNLHDFIIQNSKSDKDVIVFVNYYEESAPILYQKLGLEY
jgi:hypothetical protein